MNQHIETLEEMFAVAANERRMKEADACAAAIALMRDDCAMRAAAKFLDYCDAQAAPFTAIATLQALCEEGVKVEIDPKELLDFFSAALQQKESSL